MKSLATLSTVAIAATLLSATSFADGREPGSVLVYPVHRSGLGSFPGTNGGPQFTVLNVTNTNLMPAIGAELGGTTNIQFDYVNVYYENPPFSDPLKPNLCVVTDIVEQLTPGDTYSVLTQCKNGNNKQGYVVVHAQDPALFKTAWSWNYLIGSELVLTATGGVYQLDALPFEAIGPDKALTDGEGGDGDGQLDFDDVEYEGIPDILYIDNVLAITGNSLALINMTGGTGFTATVKFDLWNNNEYPFSTFIDFKCWFEARLWDLDGNLTNAWLFNNTPTAANELDTNCDGQADFTTFWAKIYGVIAHSNVESQPDPALIGAITAPRVPGFEGGKSLWEEGNQTNGDFIKFGGDDPEW
jgi:hypothetical protein